MWTDPNTFNSLSISENSLIQHAAYRSFNPLRSFRLYMSNRGLAKQGQLNWADSRKYNPGSQSYPMFDQDGLARAAVNFRFTCKGSQPGTQPPAGFSFGQFEVIHYLRFRG